MPPFLATTLVRAAHIMAFFLSSLWPGLTLFKNSLHYQPSIHPPSPSHSHTPTLAPRTSRSQDYPQHSDFRSRTPSARQLSPPALRLKCVWRRAHMERSGCRALGSIGTILRMGAGGGRRCMLRSRGLVLISRGSRGWGVVWCGV